MAFSTLLLGFRHKKEKGTWKGEIKRHKRNVMDWGRGGRLGAAGQTLTVICFATPTGLAPASSSPVMTATCFRDQRASLAREWLKLWLRGVTTGLSVAVSANAVCLLPRADTFCKDIVRSRYGWCVPHAYSEKCSRYLKWSPHNCTGNTVSPFLFLEETMCSYCWVFSFLHCNILPWVLCFLTTCLICGNNVLQCTTLLFEWIVKAVDAVRFGFVLCWLSTLLSCP